MGSSSLSKSITIGFFFPEPTIYVKQTFSANRSAFFKKNFSPLKSFCVSAGSYHLISPLSLASFPACFYHSARRACMFEKSCDKMADHNSTFSIASLISVLYVWVAPPKKNDKEQLSLTAGRIIHYFILI